MAYDSLKTLLRKYWFCYFLCILTLLGLKYFYSRADCNALYWILAPTARWVSILSGISFERLPGAGYVNHSLRFLIAPSCSGVRFLIITFATLSFSFLHRTKSVKMGLLWIASSLCIAYPFTIFVNGVRIALSIRLPDLLSATGQTFAAAQTFASAQTFAATQTFASAQTFSGALSCVLSPKRLHTLIGIAVYFTSLLVIYRITAALLPNPADLKASPAQPSPQPRTFPYLFGRVFPPVFWYLSLTLGFPLLCRTYRCDDPAFSEYALLLLISCPLILLLSLLIRRIFRYLTGR